jgi:hypothetical protein
MLVFLPIFFLHFHVRTLSFRDFNLDEKIEALPSLSLEEFQLKKKARKKRNPSSGSSKKTLTTSAPVAAAATTRLRTASLDTHSAGE